MPRPDLSDPAGLATLACRRDREIRPTLLRMQARAFADQPIRDKRTCDTFAALACGLLPLVSDAVADEIAAILASVPDTPASFRRLLTERVSAPAPVRAARDPSLTRHAVADLLFADRRDVDRALAANPSVALDPRSVALLVERGRRDGDLARILLSRPEPGALDRAALYLHADRPVRDGIRLSLARAAAVAAAPSLPRPSKARRKALLACAGRGDWAGLLAAMGAALAIAPVPEWPRDREAGRELVAMALGLLGLDAAERIAVLRAAANLEAGEPDRLAALGGVPVACAARLVGAGTAPAKRGLRPASPRPVSRDEGEEGPRRRGATARPERATETPARSGRRSRSTTGPDRT